MIIGINFKPELTGIGRYTGEMAEWLTNNDYNCSVITSFPYYPNWKVQKPYGGRFFRHERLKAGRLNLYRCPMYIPANPSGAKRIIHEFTFFLSAFIVTIGLLFKPKHGFIFCIAPPFHLGFLALLYRFFKGGKIIYHIQDLQIEAAKDLKIVNSEIVFKILFGLEKFILRKVDFISSISTGMIRKIVQKSSREVSLFPNWVDIDYFFPLNDKGSLKVKWGFNADDKIVLYSGSIGEKQGLEALIDIAEKLTEEKYIRFIICGNGPYKGKLEKLANERGVGNITFMPLQENNVFNEFLNLADVHLVLQKSGASDLVMPSKLTTILATGGLVIATADKGTSLYDDILSNQMGIVIPPEDNNLLNLAIRDACSKPFDDERLNARKYAQRYLNREVILRSAQNSILINPKT